MSISAGAAKRSTRSTLAFAAIIALLMTMFAVVTTSSSPADAAQPWCGGTTLFGVVPDNPVASPTNTAFVQINGSSVGNAQLSGSLVTRSPADTNLQNGLGITADGSTGYSAADTGTTIRGYDMLTDTWTSYPGRPLPAGGEGIVAGAVDPASGIYYFGDVGAGPTDPTLGHLWGFDTNTNQLVSPAPLITFPSIAGENNGDIAFDGAGNLYIVTSSTTHGDLEVVPGPLPTTAAQAQLLQPTLLSGFAVPPAAGAAVNGIAFDAAGTLYLSLSGAAGGVFSIDPGTGASQSALTPLSAALIGPSGTGLVDLASCSFPPSVSVQKNVVSRVNPTDQFTLTVTGPTVSLPATATTVGTADGLQQTAGGQVVQAGPALARFSDTYTATETASGTTDLSQYTATYSCVDVVNPANPQFPITGSGTTVSFPLDPFAGESPSVVCTFTNAALTSGLTLDKTASPTAVSTVGQTVTYTFHVTNTGGTTLTGIGITETAFSGTGSLSPIACDATTLAPTASTDCTATYQVTAADIASGIIDNTAEATGNDPGDNTVTSPPATATVTAVDAALDLTKTANPTTVTAAGDMITYTFHVTNTGNVPIDSIAIQEGSFSGTGSLSPITCNATALAPAAATDCTATYQATQADIDAGRITNDAAATGDDPGGDTVTSNTDDATVTTSATPALTLTKTVDPTSGTAAGQSVTYSFLIENTGDTTITDPAAAEVTFTGTGTAPVIDCPTGVILAPGDSTICTAPYTLTQADIDAGRVDNTAVATGNDPGDDTVTSNDSTVTLTTPPAPALTLTKTADPTSVSAAGQSVEYTFRVSNTGNTTLTSIVIAETAFTGTGALPAPVCDATTLAPGESTQCTTTYTTTAADLGATRIDNTAVATGQDPADGTVTSPDASAEVTVIQPAPALELTKTASPTTVTAAGDTITYSFQVTNTGNVTLTDVTVVERSFSGTGSPLSLSCPADTTLDAGESLTCTADYQTTVADIAAGSIVNTAGSTGIDPDGDTVTSPESSAVVQVTPASVPTPPAKDDPLAETGASIPSWLAPLAALLAIAGIGLSVIATRSRNRKNAR